MGRRSVNTTKSGKYMNPTDQARKEARKRELKKNKKQRMAVRHAVLKSKDALQLLEEAAMYDKQEYDPNVQSSLNERVLQEKRKRLLDTFDRLVVLYRKEDPEYATRLQSALNDYDKRRQQMMLYYEQVKLAERVKASEIPLPEIPQSQFGIIAAEIPLPSGLPITFTKSILKKPFGPPGLPPGIPPVGRKPPGPPPTPIPDLSDSDSEDIIDVYRQRKIRFADLPDDFNVEHEPLRSSYSVIPPPSQIPLPPPMGLPNFQGNIRPGFSGAPGLSQSRPIFISGTGGPILSAPPSLHSQRATEVFNSTNDRLLADHARSMQMGTTIEAKPQLKNLIGDATRFVPTALKIKRLVKDAQGRLVVVGGGGHHSNAIEGQSNLGGTNLDRLSRGEVGDQTPSAPCKDNAYDEFMREMEGLL